MWHTTEFKLFPTVKQQNRLTMINYNLFLTFVLGTSMDYGKCYLKTSAMHSASKYKIDIYVEMLHTINK